MLKNRNSKIIGRSANRTKNYVFFYICYYQISVMNIKMKNVTLNDLDYFLCRSRSAFKLIELDDKYKFLMPGCTVIDCGASPGGWTQVATRRCNADQKGKLSSSY